MKKIVSYTLFALIFLLILAFALIKVLGAWTALLVLFGLLGGGIVLGGVAAYFSFSVLKGFWDRYWFQHECETNRRIGKFFREYEKEKVALEKGIENLKISGQGQNITEKLSGLDSRFYEYCRSYLWIEQNLDRGTVSGELDTLAEKIRQSSALLKEINIKVARLSVQEQSPTLLSENSGGIEEFNYYLDAQIETLGSLAPDHARKEIAAGDKAAGVES